MKFKLSSTLAVAALLLFGQQAFAEQSSQSDTSVYVSESEEITPIVEEQPAQVDAVEEPLESESQVTETIEVIEEAEEVIAQSPAVHPITGAVADGLVQSDGLFQYYRSGRAVTGIVSDGSQTYYVQANGTPFTGIAHDRVAQYVVVNNLVTPNKWLLDQGAWYYSNESGQAKIGWHYDQQYRAWFYFNRFAEMVSNSLEEIDGDYYFLQAGGAMKTGWHTQDSEWLYFNEYGRMQRGWLFHTGWQKWYHFDQKSGFMDTGIVHIDGQTYRLDSNGQMLVGWYLDAPSGHWYYYNKTGEQLKNTWYYSPDYKGWYYFDADGKMFRGLRYDEQFGAHYFFDVSGKMATSSQRDRGVTLHITSNGHVSSGSVRQYERMLGQNSAVSEEVQRLRETFLNMNNVIFIDPGHGGTDPGASYHNLQEKEMVMAVYRLLRQKLEASGYTVLTSRHSDETKSLTERSRMSNRTDADLFLSIHFNAGGKGLAHGIETWWYEEEPGFLPYLNKTMHDDEVRLERSEYLAKTLQKQLIAETGANDRGIKRASFAVLRETVAPAALVELGFMDNYNESQKIRQAQYQEKMARGLFNGILDFYRYFK